MRKKDLTAVVPLNLPTEKEVPREKCPEISYLCSARIIEQDAPILDLHIWSLNVDTPNGLIARVFIDKKANDFISLVLGEKKYRSRGIGYEYIAFDPRWSEASISNLVGSCAWYNNLEQKMAIAKGSDTVIKRYFRGRDGTPLDIISEFQRKKREANTKKRNAEKRQAVDRVMSMLRPLPKNWNNFVENNVLLESRYIVYERIKKNLIKGFCTKCGNTVTLEKAKHNTKGTCPACKSPVHLKSKGITHKIVDWSRAEYLQHCPNGSFIVRSFQYTRRFNGDMRTHEDTAREERRYYLPCGGSWVMFDEYCKQWRKRNTFETYKSRLYPDNIRNALTATRYQYSGAEVMADNMRDFSIIGYLKVYEKYPCLEYIPKIKLFTVASELSMDIHAAAGCIRLSKKTPREVLPYSKEALRMFSRMDMNCYEIGLYSLYAAKGYRISDERLTTFRNYNVPAYELLDLPLGVNPFKMCRYLIKQKDSKRTMQTLLGMWKDYLKMAAVEKFDLGDDYYRFPPDLVLMHDEVDTLTRMKGMDSRFVTKFLKRAKEYEPLNFTNEKYIVRVPLSLEDFVYNSMKLKICAANPNNGYIQAYCNKRKYMLFLRKVEAPDIPFVTFEMFPNGNIGQVSGYDNHSVSAQAMTAINHWRHNVARSFLEQGSCNQKTIVAVAI